MENYPKLDHTKTDVFREQVQYSDQMKKRLAEARKEGVTALRKIEEELGYLKNAESGVVVDLFLSYRAVKGWPEMVKLVEKMSPPLAATLMIQEQLGLALNRLGKAEEAASEALCNACAAVREKWEPEPTARNLRLIREARERRGETLSWAQEAEAELARKAAPGGTALE